MHAHAAPSRGGRCTPAAARAPSPQSVMPAYASPQGAGRPPAVCAPDLFCCGGRNCKARTCRLPKVALPFERRHRERDGRVRPAPEAQVGRQRKHTDGRGRARRPQPRVAEGGVVERQENGKGCEVARVHAHRLARGRPPVQHEWQIETQVMSFPQQLRLLSVLEEAKQTAFMPTRPARGRLPATMQVQEALEAGSTCSSSFDVPSCARSSACRRSLAPHSRLEQFLLVSVAE